MNTYHVIVATSIIELVSRVNKAMKEGWRPIGGLVVAQDGDDWSYGQALIHDSAPPRELGAARVLAGI